RCRALSGCSRTDRRTTPPSASTRLLPRRCGRGSHTCMSVLADTGALFGVTEATDEWHDRLRAWFSSTATAVIVPVTVLQETAYMINVRRGAAAEAAFLR